jgi:replicative DNA helicase
METQNALEAELSVLASCIYSSDGEVFDDISRTLTEGDFHDHNNANIFSAIRRVVNNKDEINEVSLAEELRKMGVLEKVGGLSQIFQLMDFPRTAIAGATSAKIVLRHSQSRKLSRHYRRQVERLEANESPQDIASATETELREIMDTTENSKQCLEKSAMELKQQLEDIFEGRYVSKKIPTGISHLDEKLDEGGIGLGEVCVVAAPTSCGKSQLALNFVLRNSIVDNVPSCIFSFEMPASQLTKRMTQTASAVNLKGYHDLSVTPAERDRVDESIEKISKAPIYTEHHVRGIDDLRSKARRLKRKHGIKIVVVDYLQLIPFNPNLSKHEGISQASHGIKQMAMELDVAVILLVQVNRTGAMRDTGLVLYDLKDSGDIENDADIALLMYPQGGDIDSCRRVDQKTGKSYLEMEYNVAKNREGERDLKGRFRFINSTGRFQ